jgi:signal transduction histidine kinase
MTRRDYVANISHELRTPLQTLRGLIEPLADGMVKTEEDRMRYYDIILNETLRLSRLIDDMLELSKLQSRTIAFQMFPFDMNEILASVQARFTPVMKEARIYFTVQNNTGVLPTVMGNPDRVNQILVILLDNAKKYTPSGGRITITSEYSEEVGKVFISVSDTGQGIHEYDINHIFERFFKADRARGKKGTGLGLAIAKELLTYMGEDITVESEYGKGTKFTFTLKKAEAVNSWE